MKTTTKHTFFASIMSLAAGLLSTQRLEKQARAQRLKLKSPDMDMSRCRLRQKTTPGAFGGNQAQSEVGSRWLRRKQMAIARAGGMVVRRKGLRNWWYFWQGC